MIEPMVTYNIIRRDFIFSSNGNMIDEKISVVGTNFKAYDHMNAISKFFSEQIINGGLPEVPNTEINARSDVCCSQYYAIELA